MGRHQDQTSGKKTSSHKVRKKEHLFSLKATRLVDAVVELRTIW